MAETAFRCIKPHCPADCDSCNHAVTEREWQAMKVKERPILFSGPMARALLDGTKTQTRRIVKPQPPEECGIHYMLGNESWLPEEKRTPLNHHWEAWGGPLYAARPKGHLCGTHNVKCPHGKPGERLWVRETWGVGSRPDPWGGYEGIEYRADEAWLEEDDLLHCHKVETPDDVCLGDYSSGWKPSIHMPRWASRILLEITDVRVERLRDISEADALAEGIYSWMAGLALDPKVSAADVNALTARYGIGPRSVYAALWDSINGDTSSVSWAANPYVWAVSFKVLKP